MIRLSGRLEVDYWASTHEARRTDASLIDVNDIEMGLRMRAFAIRTARLVSFEGANMGCHHLRRNKNIRRSFEI